MGVALGCRRRLAVAAAGVVLVVPHVRAAERWERMSRLADERYAHAQDVTAAVLAGGARVQLPMSIAVDGRRWDSLVVGVGAVDLIPSAVAPPLQPLAVVPAMLGDDSPAIRPASSDATPQAARPIESANAFPVDAPAQLTAPASTSTPARLDVLAGDGVRLGPGAQVLLESDPDGVAVRWTELVLPDGETAAAEVLVDLVGRLTVQYLHVPPSALGAATAGIIHIAPGLAPVSASAFRLGADEAALPRNTNSRPATALPGRPSAVVPRLPPVGVPARPASTDPLPPGCLPQTGTWCDEADGPGTANVFLQEDFNDGNAGARGWGVSADAEWHMVPYAAPCPPGATTNPGYSAYCGQDASCTYLDNTTASLFSPVIGPLSANAKLWYQFRWAYENVNDLEQVYVNGTLLLNQPATQDPTQWYSWQTPIDLSAFAGQTVQIEWRLTSDASINDLGWFVDDVEVWDDNGAIGNCVRTAGMNGYDPCSQTVNTRWSFYEGGFCQMCQYTFYVLVECGHEMHLPLNDMEGADVQITSMITGQPVSLHCINQTARADAGQGPYPTEWSEDCSVNCSGIPSPQQWWGPAFDQTDSLGTGHVTWGFPGCPYINAYDDCAPAQVINCCDFFNAGIPCGGLLPNVSPGDNQVMDCSISDAVGLCGLYRVDITSGGYGWQLFANCDGSSNPSFRIFSDCTTAWAAYNPLPELAVTNLTVTGGCPTLSVSFDIQNLGCKDHPGPTLARITSNCTPPDSQDYTIPDPVPANGSVHVSNLAFTPSCQPVRVQVTIDPDNTIAECSESVTAAACRAQTGSNVISQFTCGCTANLIANAGADQALCPNTLFTISGAASTIAPCATPQYRWRDSTGRVVQDWSSVATYSDFSGNCPAGNTYTVDVKCMGESCTDSDTVTVSCLVPNANAGTDVTACVGTPVSLSGSASSIPGCSQVMYRWTGPTGLVLQNYSTNPNLALGAMTCNLNGPYFLDVMCASGGSCTASDSVRVQCVQVTANAGSDLVTCEGQPTPITSAGSNAQGCSQVVYQWFDTTGQPLTPILTDPGITVPGLSGCPGTLTLVLAAACNDPGLTNCGSTDSMTIFCSKPQTPVPTSTDRCGGPSADLACGVSPPEAGVAYTWDLDTSTDSDGDTIPDDDADLTGCDVLASWPSAGTRTVRAIATDTTSSCTATADLVVTSFADPQAPVPTALPGCPGVASQLSCGISPPEAGVTYTWDEDTAVDSDGNTVADDDTDATGCDVSPLYPTGTLTARVTATDGRGCKKQADIPVTVGSGAPPAEVLDDRTTRSGASLTLTWTPAAGAAGYRISRGTLQSLHQTGSYDHAADDTASRGACNTGNVLTWTDADDCGDGTGYYYLITAISACGVEGPPGSGQTSAGAFPRAARTPTASCP